MKGPFDEHGTTFYLLLGHSEMSLCVCVRACVCVRTCARADEIAPYKLASELVLR